MPAVDAMRLIGEELEIAQGKSNAAIADSLAWTKRAVEKHISSIFLKLGLAFADDVSTRVKAALLYLAAADTWFTGWRRDGGRGSRHDGRHGRSDTTRRVWERAYDNWLVIVGGFLILPWTTVAYAVMCGGPGGRRHGLGVGRGRLRAPARPLHLGLRTGLMGPSTSPSHTG